MTPNAVVDGNVTGPVGEPELRGEELRSAISVRRRRARLEYQGGYRHAYLGEVAAPVIYGV